MLPNHRNFYYSDVGLFLLLATPWLNEWVIGLVLSFGDTDFFVGSAKTMLTTFVGIAGVLGLGFSLLRLNTPDSRSIVMISFFVKLFAGSWMLFAYFQGISLILLIFAVADLGAALVLSAALIKQT
ncbi:Uncharacterised protein [Zhongshania aliphaticivorans]|uniref:Uncharacterized protein n=1 Tax=Zhongshania aliphaticivorans TaxID=1470434 RepID=A0A5S9MWI5_9GAMM|nr:hypothetical protein [Zhongshania aliphaticivorans]CAA0081085.1 Uncharacterised protein [Zhongshania aliphaticivorans]CAA0085144.1 Uncharacterised protein [Zhongshania aliphaticivorans]